MALARTTLLAAALAAAFGAAPASAQETVAVAYTGGADAAAMFVAVDKGMFAKHGITVKPTLIPIMPNMPAALVSGSTQLGAMTATVLIQAADGGLDLVAASGSTVTSKTVHNLGVVVRPDSGLKAPQDFVGKRVGVPGFGAYAHVVTRKWLDDAGVDPKKVNFVELTLPAIADALKGTAVDAAVAVDPFLGQIVASKSGVLAISLVDAMPEGKPVILYGATREWADAHPKELAAFRDGIREGSEFVRSNPDEARAIVAKAIHVPPDIAKTFLLGFPDPAVTVDQLAWWVQLMGKQEMLQTKVDATKLVEK